MMTGGAACSASPMMVPNRTERSPGPGRQMLISSSASLRLVSRDASATRFFGTLLPHWPLPQVYESARRSLEYPASLRRSFTTEIPGASPASAVVPRVAKSFQVVPSACSSSTEHAYGTPGPAMPAIFLPSGSRYVIFPFSLSTSDSAISSMATMRRDRKSTRLNSSHVRISYAVFCLKKKKTKENNKYKEKKKKIKKEK